MISNTSNQDGLGGDYSSRVNQFFLRDTDTSTAGTTAALPARLADSYISGRNVQGPDTYSLMIPKDESSAEASTNATGTQVWVDTSHYEVRPVVHTEMRWVDTSYDEYLTYTDPAGENSSVQIIHHSDGHWEQVTYTVNENVWVNEGHWETQAAPPPPPPPPPTTPTTPQFIPGATAINEVISRSATLKSQMGAFAIAGGVVVWGKANEGSRFLAGSPNRIQLDSTLQNDPARAASALAHELGHWLYPATPNRSTLDAYVLSLTMSEGNATLNNIAVMKELAAATPATSITVVCDGANLPAYLRIYDQFKADGNRTAAATAIANIYLDHETVSGTTKTYRTYYGEGYTPPAH